MGRPRDGLGQDFLPWEQLELRNREHISAIRRRYSKMTRLLITAVAACLLATTVEAQAPAGLHFEIEVSDGQTAWKLGERIPITMRFWATTPNRWMADTRTQDRIGRMNYTEEFRVEPTGGVRDPLTGLRGQSGGFGGISGGPHQLGTEPYEIERDLNEWIEFTRPGTIELR
jgi:hypothetical protein